MWSPTHCQPWPGCGAGENVEAGFKPVGKAVRDLERFVPLVLGGVLAVNGATCCPEW